MNSFPTFDFDRFPKNGDYEDFHRAVQEFQKHFKSIEAYGKLEVETEEQKEVIRKSRDTRASAAALPIEDEQIEDLSNAQNHLVSIQQNKTKIIKWRSLNSASFQKDTLWQTICSKAEEKFQQSEPAKCTEWQTRRERWKQHAIFTHYTSIGLDGVHTCIKNVHILYNKAINALAKSTLSQDFITEYQKYLEQVKIWKENTKQALIYSILARLELAAQEKDVAYDDLLFPLYTQVNQLLEVQEQKGFTSDVPLRTMTPELFQKFHLAIFKYQKKYHREDVAKRVNTLPWFHEKSVPFGIKAIIHSKQLFVVPSGRQVKKFSIAYNGPSICDLALCTIYWEKLQKLISIGALDDFQQIQDVYKIISQLVGFYIKQFDAVQRVVFGDAKMLQDIWRDKLQKESDRLFTAVVSFTDCFFKIAEKNSKESLTLCPIFHRLNELADNTLSIGNAAVEYKKKRARVQGIVGAQFGQAVLKQNMQPSAFFELFLTLIPPQLKEAVDILRRVIRDSESGIEASTSPILEQVRDALSTLWTKSADTILTSIVEYLVQTVTDPKSPLLSIIKQYDASIQSSNKKTPLYIVRWLSDQNERIKEVQEKLVQSFPLEKMNEDAFSAQGFDGADAIVSSIEQLKAYAELDRGLLDQLKSHLRKYIEQKAVSEYSNVLFKALTLLQDQTLFYEFGKKHFQFCKASLKVILRDAFFFELLHFCPQLRQEVCNDIFKCMDSHIEDVIQNIANFGDFSILSDKQKEYVLLAIDKYWLHQLQGYSAIDEDVLRVKLNKAKSFLSTLTLPQFPLTERYKKEIVHWLDDKLVQHTYKFDSALEVVLMCFGTVEQKQKFYTVCFEYVFDKLERNELASQILLRSQLLGYRDFLKKYGRENVSKVFEYVKKFFKNPVFDETRYTILKNNFSITDEGQEQESENIVDDENYRTYCYLCKEFEKVFNEQYSAIISTIDLLEAGAYKEAYISAQVLGSKIPASGRTLLTEADHHAKEVMKLLFKKIKEWLLAQITDTKKYSIDSIQHFVNLFKKEFLTPCIAKQNVELYEWFESLSTLCEKAGDIFDFYRNIQNLVHSAFNTSWLIQFNRKNLSEIFELLPISAKRFLLDQLIKTPLIGQSAQAREAWVLLIAVIKGQSTDRAADLNRIQELAASEKSSIQENSNNVDNDYALLSERIWDRQLRAHFPQCQGNENNAIQLLRMGSCQVSEEVWQQLFDSTGTPLLGKKGNRHIVIPVTSANKQVFYFKFVPDAPGIQWMSCTLRELLWGEKNQKTFKMELAKFPAGTGDTSIAYPVLISQEVPGKTLAELWQENPDIQLHRNSFSREFLRILIDLEQDGKPENYIAVAMDDGSYQLVNVDGEQAFAPTAVLRSVSATGTVTTQLLTKSILFCCPNMKDNVPNEIIDEFLKINPIEFLQTFIRDVYRYNTLLLQLFSHKECMLWWNQKEQRFLVAPLREDLIQSMYTTLCRIQDAFRQAKSKDGITHIELLRRVHPLLASYYEVALEDPLHPSKRFLEVVANEYKVIHNTEKEQEQFLTSRSSRQVVQSMFGFIPDAQTAFASYVISADRALHYLESIANQSALIRQAQQELIDGINAIWKKITLPLYKEQVLNGVPGVFHRIMWQKLSKDEQMFILQSIINEVKEKKLSVQALNLSHCSVLSNDMLKQIIEMSPELKFLDISYCSQLDQTIVRQLSFYCPLLQKLKMDGLSISTIANGWWWLYSPLEFPELQYLSCNESHELTRVALRVPKLQVIQFKNCKQLNKLFLECPNFTQGTFEGCDILLNRTLGERDITIFDTTKMLQNTVQIDFREIRRDPTHLQLLREKLIYLKGVTELIIKNPCTAEDNEKKPGVSRRESEFVFWLLKMHGQSLTSLDVSSCLWVDDSKLKEIITACPGLKRLNCANTRITDASKATFYIGNVQLKVVDISNTYSGNELAFAIVERCLYLESINLSKTLVTDKGLHALKQYSKNLKEIDLSECHAVSDKGIASLLEKREINRIAVADGQVKDRLVLTILKHRELIKFVKFCNAPNVGDNALYISEIGYTTEATIQGVTQWFFKEDFRYIKALDLSYCKNIESLTNDANLSKNRDLGLLSIIKHCSSLEQLNIASIDIRDKVLEELAQQLSLLKKINLSECKKITTHGLYSLMKKCSYLEELNLAYTGVSNKLFEKMPNQLALKKVDLTWCTEVTDRGLIALLQKCPHLEELNLQSTGVSSEEFEKIPGQVSLKKVDLTWCTEVIDRGILVLLQKCPYLEELNLAYTGVSGEVFEKIPDQVSLKKVDLMWCTEVTERGLLALLQKCPYLEELNLAHTRVNCEGLEKTSKQLSLKKVDLTWCTEVIDRGILVLLQKCPYLEELDLQNTGVSCEVFAKIPDQLSLKKVDLTWCTEVTDRGLAAFLQKCPHLEELNLQNTGVSCEIFEKMVHYVSLHKVYLSNCKKVTDQGLIALLQKCPHLEELNLGKTGVSDEVFETVTHQMLLRKVNLTGCPKVTDRGLLALLQKCPYIEELYFSGSEVSCEVFEKIVHYVSLRKVYLSRTRVTAQGLLAILQKCPCLEELDLQNTRVSCEVFEKMSDQLLLKKVDLTWCEEMTERGLLALLQKCPYLEELNLQHTGVNCEVFEKIPDQLLLKKVDLTRCEKMTERGLLALLQKCPHLEELNFPAKGVSDEVFENIPQRISLIKADLNWCEKMTERGLLALLQKCPYLEELNLQHTGVNCESFENISHQLILRKIDLSYCKVTDRGLAAFLQKCPHLEELELNNTRVSDKAFLNMSKQVSLRKISLDDCINVIDQGFITLLQKCPHLEELILTDTKVSNEAFEKMSQKMSLRAVYLTWCRKLTEQGFIALLQKCPNIEELYFPAKGVSDEVFEKMPQQVSLRKVDLTGCAEITKRGLDVLIEKSPYLFEIDLQETSITRDIVITLRDKGLIIHASE